MKVDIYSDVVCPWCYIGERRFARALAAFPGGEQVDVGFRPYRLDPDAPATPRPLIESLGRKFGARVPEMLSRVSEVARDEGIEMRWDDALAVNTLSAHRVLRLAGREHGPAVQRALAERLFDAHFARGADISDAATLGELAGAAGMDADGVCAHLATDDGMREVLAEIEQAQRLGIRAVPTFVFDGQYVVEGGQSAPVFLQVLEEVARLGRAEGGAATEREGDDACLDGACRT
jgi:predicted DsbA family dithiol-disulfide isomerase